MTVTGNQEGLISAKSVPITIQITSKQIKADQKRKIKLWNWLNRN
jgi:hypothetical protein